MTYDNHPTQSHPIPQSLFNHLKRPWIDLIRPPMNYKMTLDYLTFCLHSDYILTSFRRAKGEVGKGGGHHKLLIICFK